MIYVNSLYWVFFVPALVTYRCRLPLLALISSTFFLRRWQQSPLRDFHHPQGFQKPPQQRPFVEFRRYFVLQHFAMFWHANVFSRNLSQKYWLGFAQDFCLDLCFCGYRSGEPFAKGDLDAEWDAVARQCPAYCWGAVSKQCLCTCGPVDGCWWMLMFVDACNAWSSLTAGLHAGLHQRCWGTLKHCFSHLFCFVSSFDDVEEGWGNPTI